MESDYIISIKKISFLTVTMSRSATFHDADATAYFYFHRNDDPIEGELIHYLYEYPIKEKKSLLKRILAKIWKTK